MTSIVATHDEHCGYPDSNLGLGIVLLPSFAYQAEKKPINTYS